MDSILFTLQEVPVTVWDFCMFVLISGFFFFVAKLVKKGIEKAPIFKQKPPYLLSRLSYYVIFLLGIYIALTNLGINLTGIAVVAGALGVGIGFGLQSVFSNFVSGIILLAEKKVRPGDHIQLESGDTGTVLEVNIRTTVVHTLDGRKMIVPNTEMISKRVANWTLGEGLHRLRIPFAVERTVKREKVETLAVEAAKGISSLAKAPEVWLIRLTETTQEFELVVWARRVKKRLSSFSTTDAFLTALQEVFEKEGIVITSGTRMPSPPPLPLQEV